jgi:LPS export ABC transporter protein LptC
LKEDLTNRPIFKNIIAALDIFPNRFLHFVVLVIILAACNQRKDLVDQELYTGPLSSMDSINTFLSDSANLVMHLKAARQNDFESGDKEWPEGLFLESYGKDGGVTTMFKSNYVYYTKEDNLYHAKGNVIVKNYGEGDELNTEELFWNPAEKRFYTDKFVTINSDGEIHTGEGMDANQDFTEYRILKPSGTFTLEDDPSQRSSQQIELKN